MAIAAAFLQNVRSALQKYLKDEDKELQERFWLLFGPNKIKSPNLRIGAEFLRKNKDLLQ